MGGRKAHGHLQHRVEPNDETVCDHERIASLPVGQCVVSFGSRCPVQHSSLHRRVAQLLTLAARRLNACRVGRHSSRIVIGSETVNGLSTRT